jgi:hypothetical protein
MVLTFKANFDANMSCIMYGIMAGYKTVLEIEYYNNVVEQLCSLNAIIMVQFWYLM